MAGESGQRANTGRKGTLRAGKTVTGNGSRPVNSNAGAHSNQTTNYFCSSLFVMTLQQKGNRNGIFAIKYYMYYNIFAIQSKSLFISSTPSFSYC